MKSLPPTGKTARNSLLRSSAALSRGFSLLELLVVMAVMGILLSSSVVGLSSYQGQTFTKQAYDMRDILSSAKASAMAKNTFVWVGFGSCVSNGLQTTVVSVFASRSGLNDSSSANLTTLMRPCSFPNFLLTRADQMAAGPAQAGTDLSSSAAAWSLPSQQVNGTAVSMSQAILFSPSGQCFLTAAPLSYIDIGMKPTHGTVAVDSNLAALQVSGLTSQVQLYRE